MSRDLEEGTYYVSQGGKVPVKWTAPEVINDPFMPPIYSLLNSILQGTVCSSVFPGTFCKGTIIGVLFLQALHFKKYSTASDVWSFGCLMYEIWSLGHKPFEGYTNPDVCVSYNVCCMK